MNTTRLSIAFAVLLAGQAAVARSGDVDHAMALLGQGRLMEAEAALRRSLAGTEAADPEEDSAGLRARRVSTLEVLGSLALAAGRSDEAETLLRRALALAGRRPRLADADIASVLNGLARLLADRGAGGEAVRLASRALRAYEKERGPRRGQRADALNTIALVRASRGERDEAEALLRRARRIAELEGAPAAIQASTAANLAAADERVAVVPRPPASTTWRRWSDRKPGRGA
jgi:tetratricopeptide (TPR) repeat protein